MKAVERKVPLTLCEQPIPCRYEETPEFTAEDYSRRIEAAWAAPQAADMDVLIVYGDREHFSNVHYFTGYDVRWEETLLLLARGVRPVLLVGNEGLGYTAGLTAELEVKMYQSFSLMGQPNDRRSRKLTEYFSDFGIGPGVKVGLIGWKVYRPELFEKGELLTDIPYYIVRALASLTGTDHLYNVTDLLTDCEHGLKHNVSAREIVQYELAGTTVSRGIYRCIKNARPGMNARELTRLIGLDGQPDNSYPNVKIGGDVFRGLCGAQYQTKLAYGMHFGAGYGLRGCLVHHLGMYIRRADDLPEGMEGYIEELLKPYFLSVAHWYESVRPGAVCGDIYQLVETELGMEKYHISLNPGHMSHTDEWTNSPFCQGSTVRLRSGMMLQCDYTVSLRNPGRKAHVEDGLVLADAALQEEIASIAPTCFQRIQARQRFLRESLHIHLPEEVLPLSDLSCVCFPYMADTSVLLVKED